MVNQIMLKYILLIKLYYVVLLKHNFLLLMCEY